MATPTTMPDDQYQKFMVEIAKLHQRMTDHYAQEEKFRQDIRSEISEKLDPIYEIFVEAKGFGNVTVVIVKSLITFAAVVGVIYGFVKWLKN